MRALTLTLLLSLSTQNAFAQPDTGTFRPVSFICRDGATGTSVKIEENIAGNRKRYEVSYFSGKPTLFIISKSRHGGAFARVGMIDLRSETDPDDIEAAHYLAHVMTQDAARFCKGTRRNVLAARYELQANHDFNRSHPRYRGR